MARLRCCDTTAKILLIIFNCIFWAFGIAILGIGIWIKTDPELSNLGQAIKVGNEEPVVEVITWLFIGAGIFVFAVGVVGMIGIISESKIIMGFYIVCVFIVFAAEGSAGVYAGIRKDFIKKQLENEGSNTINKLYDGKSTISRGFNYVQVKNNCCGVKNFLDYRESAYIKSLGDRIKANATMAWACCDSTSSLTTAFEGNGLLEIGPDAKDDCMTESISATKKYFSTLERHNDEQRAEQETEELCSTFSEFNCKGCFTELEEWTEDNLIIMLAIAVAVGAAQLLLLFLALWFCQSLGKGEK